MAKRFIVDSASDGEPFEESPPEFPESTGGIPDFPGATPPVEPPKANGRAKDYSPDWRNFLIMNKQGDPRSVLANAITALRQAPEWMGVLAYDEFSVKAIMQRPAPWPGARTGEWTDNEDLLLTNWLQHAGIMAGVETSAQAVQAVSRDQSFHPVREYLNVLKWDGISRIDDWLTLYMGVDATDYARAVGGRWLIAAVARIFQPGCKSDCCLILEGEQGIKKSTSLKTLGTPWFTDDLADLGSKDSMLQTRGVWIIEISELDSMTKAETGKIKSFMSRPSDRFRPPYGHRLLESPRQCSFAGSVNHDDYLKDETGGRRFWPVRCGVINIEELIRDRDQLWAEALTRYRGGSVWWLETPELNKDAAEEQAARYEGDTWDSLVLTWARDRIANGCDSVSVGEVLEICIQKKRDQWTRADEMRAGRCLRSNQWRKFRDRKRGMEWRYRAPA